MKIKIMIIKLSLKFKTKKKALVNQASTKIFQHQMRGKCLVQSLYNHTKEDKKDLQEDARSGLRTDPIFSS